MAYIYFYGYNCYGYGCLSEPPAAQLPDPNPLPDIEANYVPPTTYTSTQSAIASCPEGTVQNVVAHTIDVPGIVPPATTGSVATGFPPAFTVISVNITPTASANGNVVVKIEGSSDSVSYVTLVESNPYMPLAGETANLLVPVPTAYAYYRCTVTTANPLISAPGTYSFDLLTATGSGGVTATATATSTISQADAIQKAYSAALDDATAQLALIGCSVVYTSTQTVTVSCTTGLGTPVTITVTATSLVSQAAADADAQAQAQVQAEALLNCEGSNNTEEIVINDFVGPGAAPATPYPSVSFKSGLAGVITRIRVNILGLAHQNPEDIGILLEAPGGELVLLQLNCGGSNPITGVNLVFDSDSVNPLPNSTIISSGTYEPTQFGVQIPFAAPVPANPYPTSFAALIGTVPNGIWNLWVIDKASLDTGSIANGWTIQLDTA